MLQSRQFLTKRGSKSDEENRVQDDQLKKVDPHQVIIPVSDGEEIGLCWDEVQNFRSLDEALQKQSEPAAKPLIQRVTYMLRDNKDFLKYFIPSVIAIGPLHHDDPKLQPGEKLKLKLAALFIQNSGSTKRAFYDKINADIENLKKCYDPEEIKKYDDKKLAWMLFVDGCAVLCLLHYLYPVPDSDEKAKELKIKSDMLAFAQEDLILLENQLPYRLIQTLISTTSRTHGDKLKESIKKFIDENTMTLAEIKKKKKIQQQQEQHQMQQKRGEQQMQQKQGEQLMQQKQGEQQQQKLEDQQQQEHPAHLLELLRDGLLVEPARNEHRIGKVRRIIGSLSNRRRRSHHSYTFRNIKELKEKGILLRPSETSSLKDVSFHRSIFTCLLGILKLPPITVDDSTGPKFMNLIAYEMCPDFENEFEISSYIFLLDSLIDQAEDVKELRDSGILHNGLGSDEEVAILFNKMCTDLVPNLELYSKVKSSIQNHCNNRWATSSAQAYHTHFSTPWTFLAFVGAIVALALSGIQTYYTIHPK